MKAISVTAPGHYKKVKTYDSNRRCLKCKVPLSIYNKEKFCFPHQRD